MNAVIKIPISDINSNFIETLKEKYGEAELEINVQPADQKEILSEADFWEIIDLLDWDKSGDDAAVLKPAIEHLAALPVSFIYQFQDKLSEKLYLLDT